MGTAPGTQDQPPAPAAPAPGPARPRPVGARASILYKVVGVLVVTLVVSSVVTAFIASRLTQNALSAQVRRIARSQLTVMREAFGTRESDMVADLRSIAQQIDPRNVSDPAGRSQLIAELGAQAGLHQLDLVRVLGPDGRDLPDPIGLGPALDEATIFAGGSPIVEPASRLLATGRDPRVFVQSVAVPVGGSGQLVLVGGRFFDDGYAYDLRQQIGSLDDVLLVVRDEVAGATLPRPPTTPPGGDGGSPLPEEPAMVQVSGTTALVAYASVGRNIDDPEGGALGVVLTNPISPLRQSLDRTRFLASLLLTLVALGLGWLLFRALIRPLVDLAAVAGRVAGGDDEATFVHRGTDEIGMLAGALERMRQELRAKLDLIARQAADLRDSSQRIVAAQDEERQRLARDLHDGIQQQLVVLRMQVGMLQDGIAPDGDPATAYDRLGAELDRIIGQLREVTHNLYPSILVDRGLTSALFSYVGRLPITTRVSKEPEDFPRLAPEIESGAYFLLCEAVTNALKHANASRVEIGLRLSGGWLEVTVADDGDGFVPGQHPPGGGLQHMEDRVRSFGGELRIDSGPARGTRVVATFPQRIGAGATAG